MSATNVTIQTDEQIADSFWDDLRVQRLHSWCDPEAVQARKRNRLRIAELFRRQLLAVTSHSQVAS